MRNALGARESVIALAGRLLAVTSIDRASFFGFYDICPWSPDDTNIVLLNCPADFLSMPAGERADVCVWDAATGALRKVGETAGWNWQHGARQRWLKDGSILFNDVQDGRQCARVVTADGVPRRTFDMSVSALNPQETLAVSSNYARLVKLYHTYGYGSARNEHIGSGANDDGLWSLDMRTGEVQLLLSYRRICERLRIDFSPDMFISHPDFSPSGDKIEFFMIKDNAAGTSFMRLLVYTLSCDDLQLATQEKVSHPAWIDDNRLWAWARESSAMRLISKSGLLSLPGAGMLARLARRFRGVARNALLSEGFFIYESENGYKKTRLAPHLLMEDGHYSKHPVYDLMLGDTYPDASGYLTLLLYSLATGRRIDVARFFHGVATDLPPLRCDLHPRWDRSGTRICVDYCEHGVRRVGVVDARDAIAAAGHEPARLARPISQA